MMRLNSYEYQSNIKKHNWNILLFVLCVASLTLNGLHNPVINTVAFLGTIVYVLFAPKDNSLLVYPIVFIFMGFSNLTMNIVGGTLDISTAANIIYLLMLIKLLYCNHVIKIYNGTGLYFLVLVICSLNILVTNKLSQAIFLVAKMFIIYHILSKLNEEKEENTEKIFTHKFIMALLIAIVGEVIYGVLFPVASTSGTWRAVQFGGVKDPNNLSLHCCLLFAIAVILNPEAVSKPLKRFIAIFMPLIVFASISFTGITMISVLLIIGLNKQLNGTKKVIAIFIFSIIAIAASFINYSSLLSTLTNSNQSTVAAFAQRLNLMLTQYKTGNYERLTSGRTALWIDYYTSFKAGNMATKLFGNAGYMNELVKIYGIASHNIYIDFLISYGIVGILFITLMLLSNWKNKIIKKSWDNIFVNLIFAITFFSRTFDLSVFGLYVLL